MPDEEAPAATVAPKTTTSGAHGVFQSDAWLAAATVAVFSTRALWVKLRKLILAKSKKKVELDDEETPNAISNKIVEKKDKEYAVNVQSPEMEQLETKLQVLDIGLL